MYIVATQRETKACLLNNACSTTKCGYIYMTVIVMNLVKPKPNAIAEYCIQQTGLEPSKGPFGRYSEIN